MQKVFFIVVLLGAVIFSSCDTEENDSVDLYDVTKEYFSYDEGSTWKYELEGNSSVVENVVSERFSTGYSDHGSKKLEFFIYDMVSSSQNKIVMRAEAGGLDPIDRIVFINYLDNSNVVYSPILWNTGIEFSMEVGDQIEYLTSFQVNSDTYNDVYHIVPDDQDVFKELYVAKNVGVIKKTYANDSTYLLVDHNVIQ
jgi:hypothetical protein